jgi:hypothetical protein
LIQIKKKTLQKKLNQIAEARFDGDERKAANELFERALVSEYLPARKSMRDLTRLKFFGMWKDREDMKDSVAWVNAQRRKAESRYKANETH